MLKLKVRKIMIPTRCWEYFQHLVGIRIPSRIVWDDCLEGIDNRLYANKLDKSTFPHLEF